MDWVELIWFVPWLWESCSILSYSIWL